MELTKEQNKSMIKLTADFQKAMAEEDIDPNDFTLIHHKGKGEDKSEDEGIVINSIAIGNIAIRSTEKLSIVEKCMDKYLKMFKNKIPSYIG